MNHRDIAGVMTAAAPAFRDYVVRAVSPIVDRLLVVERFIRDLPVARDGKDADPEVVAAMVAAEVARILPAAVEKAMSVIPAPENGKDADIEVIKQLVAAEVALLPPAVAGKDADPVDPAVVANLLVELMPVPENGKDADPAVIAEMVAAEVAKIERPADGKSVDPADVEAMVELTVEKAMAGLTLPKDGKDGEPGPAGSSVTIEDLAPVVEDLVKAAVAQEVTNLVIPEGRAGEPGASVTIDDVRPVLEEMVAAIQIPAPENGKDGRDGIDGKSVTIDDVRPVVEEVVATIAPAKDGRDGKDADPVEVAALIVEDVAKLIPPPVNGTSVTVEDVLPVIEEAIEKKVSALPVPKDGAPGRDGKDGIGLAGALLGRSGDLVLTLSDGTANSLGVIVGKDGEPGLPGKDGLDGLGFDDLEVIHDGERSFTLRYQRGDVVKEQAFTVPAVLDRGVFKEGREQPYEKGDGVSFGGSFWIAQKDAPEGKPGDGSSAWRLSVKKGRDGKDGIVRTLPPQGPVKA